MNTNNKFNLLIDEIEGIMVMVSDQEKAVEFYTQKLGFEKKIDTKVTEYRWVIVSPKNSNTVISLVNPINMKEWSQEQIEEGKKRIGMPTGIWFFTKDIDITFQDLKSKNVEMTEPSKQVWGGIMSIVYDQDHNSFGLVGDSKT